MAIEIMRELAHRLEDTNQKLRAATPLPAGVTVKESGDAEVQAELMSSFGQAMIMGLMLVLSVLIVLIPWAYLEFGGKKNG